MGFGIAIQHTTKTTSSFAHRREKEFILSGRAIDRSSITYDHTTVNGNIINGFARQDHVGCPAGPLIPLCQTLIYQILTFWSAYRERSRSLF